MPPHAENALPRPPSEDSRRFSAAATYALGADGTETAGTEAGGHPVTVPTRIVLTRDGAP